MSIRATFRQKGFDSPQIMIPASAPKVEQIIKEIPVEVIKYIDKEVIKYVETPVEKIVEVIKYVDKEVQVPVEVIKEVVNYVDKEVVTYVTKEVPVFMDRIVTRVQTHKYVWIALGIETLVLLALIAHNFKG